MAKDIIILSVDTSSAKLSIALFRGNDLLGEFRSDLPNRHSSGLIPEIDTLLSKNSYSIERVDAFCVGLGPGSFTGLRVGVTTMRGLALALRKVIIGIPSIDALAYNLNAREGDICAIIDAKQKRVYARFYRCTGNKIIPKSKILLLGIDELLRMVKQRTVFTGDGILLYKSDILKKLGQKAEFAEEASWYPKASALGRLAFERLRAGKKDNVFSLSPIYIYPKECQVKR